MVLFENGVTSALDQSSIAESRDIGTAGVFDRTVNGKPLTFTWTGGRISDQRTGSVWSILGAAVTGPLRVRGSRRSYTASTFGSPGWCSGRTPECTCPDVCPFPPRHVALRSWGPVDAARGGPLRPLWSGRAVLFLGAMAGAPPRGYPVGSPFGPTTGSPHPAHYPRIAWFTPSNSTLGPPQNMSDSLARPRGALMHKGWRGVHLNGVQVVAGSTGRPIDLGP